MAEIDASIADINANISTLQGTVLGELSALYNSANVLANHVNSITKTAYITPYPPEEKPIGVGGYFDKSYFADLDIINILSDGVTLYQPDADDPIQDDLKEFWDVESDRYEILDPSQVFDGSKYLADEIQSAKDLMTDYVNGNFNTSGDGNTSQNIEASQTIRDFATNIKTHSALLKTRIKKYNTDYQDNFEKLKKAEEEQFQSIILPLAQAMEQEGDYDDNYIKKVTGMTIQSFRTMDLKDWIDWTKTKYNIAKEFANSPLGKREKVIAMILGYNLQEWVGLKTQDPKAATDLINATDELISAVGIPTSYTSLALTATGPFGKFAGKITQVANKILAKKLPLSQGGYVNKLVANVKATKEKFQKWISKSPNSVSKGVNCFTGKAFHTQAICPSAEDFAAAFKYIKGLGNNVHLKKLYPNVLAKDVLAKSKVFKNTLSNYIKKNPNLVTDINFIKLNTKIDTQYNAFLSTGVKIKKASKYEVYAADIESHGIAVVDLGIKVKGNHGSDFTAAYEKLKIAPNLKDLIPSYVQNATQFDKFIKDIGLTWHHHEGLNKMILVDQRIHKGISHWGSVSVVTKFLTESTLKNNPFFEAAYLSIMASLK